MCTYFTILISCDIDLQKILVGDSGFRAQEKSVNKHRTVGNSLSHL